MYRVPTPRTAGCWSASIVAALILALLPTADASARRKPPIVPPPITAAEPAPSPSAFDRDGMWIWYVSRSSGGTVKSIAARAKKSGIETLFIKSSDGRNYWSQFNSSFVRQLKARGFRVCGWQYVYGRQPQVEADNGARAARAGADCLVIDAESEYEGKYAAASTYMTRLRKLTGKRFAIGLAGFPYVDYHPAYPYSVFLGPGGAQFNVPQMYWKAIGVSVDFIFSHTYLYNAIYSRPIAPLGQTYQAPSRSELLRFRDLASAYRARGLSWWSWESTSSTGWSALAQKLSPVNAATARNPVAPRLRRGARGDMVVWVQQHLLSAKQKVKVDGVYGPGTQSAVRNFQRGAKLVVNGIVDVPTWQKLLRRNPKPVRWRKGRSTATVAKSGLSLPEPKSASLPSRGREIPPKKH
jgi:hypothetical protein